jgi:hypothetical protein
MGQRGKAHEVLESAKGSFAAALSGTTAGKAVLPRKQYYRLCEAVLPLKRYYRLYAVLLESEWDSFRAGQTDLVRAKPTLWRLSLQV